MHPQYDASPLHYLEAHRWWSDLSFAKLFFAQCALCKAISCTFFQLVEGQKNVGDEMGPCHVFNPEHFGPSFCFTYVFCLQCWILASSSSQWPYPQITWTFFAAAGSWADVVTHVCLVVTTLCKMLNLCFLKVDCIINSAPHFLPNKALAVPLPPLCVDDCWCSN